MCGRYCVGDVYFVVDFFGVVLYCVGGEIEFIGVGYFLLDLLWYGW